MYKFIFLIISLLNAFTILSIEKPEIKSGFSSNGYFLKEQDYEIFYPGTSYEKLYLLFTEPFCDYFKFTHKIDFYYYNYNKYDEDLSHLRSYIFANQFYLYFYILKFNEIIIQAKPEINYYNGETNILLYSYIQYKLKVDNFCFKIKYSNKYNSKPDTLLYHNIYLSFYWTHPKYDYIKYKTSVSIYLQNYTTGLYKEISYLKSASFNFEISVDFNKIDFEEIFDKNYYDDFFE
jgi:hypothetical protein